jgi:hypothetical protein
MANNYMEFSEVLDALSPEQEQWLREQLTTVYVFGDLEYAEEQLPAGIAPGAADWIGCRVYRDVPECAEYATEMDMERPGFEYAFADETGTPDGQQRYLWLHAGEWGYVDGLAHLVQKFLKCFRPEQCWSLTFATTCSKPRIGEFGGGAVFVTAEEIRWQNSYDFIEQQRAAFAIEQKDGQNRQVDNAESVATDERRCDQSPTDRHVPDPQSVQAADGAGRNRGTDWIIDIRCVHCGRSGSMRIDPQGIQWE